MKFVVDITYKDFLLSSLILRCLKLQLNGRWGLKELHWEVRFVRNCRELSINRSFWSPKCLTRVAGCSYWSCGSPLLVLSSELSQVCLGTLSLEIRCWFFLYKDRFRELQWFQSWRLRDLFFSFHILFSNFWFPRNNFLNAIFYAFFLTDSDAVV